ncbi:MAG: hypothetical protein N3A69_15235 [Leptospiraceae bacterium]|nr:hypothetical protein [Leptospiraceae bacterium]
MRRYKKPSLRFKSKLVPLVQQTKYFLDIQILHSLLKLIFYFLAFLFVFTCNTNLSTSNPEISKPKLQKPSLQLTASEKMRLYFPVLEKDYFNEEVFTALESIRDISNETCEMIYSMKPYNKEKSYSLFDIGFL